MRLGIDLGGTKTEIIAIEDNGRERLRERVPTPVHSYGEVIGAIANLVRTAEERLQCRSSVGVAIPVEHTVTTVSISPPERLASASALRATSMNRVSAPSRKAKVRSGQPRRSMYHSIGLTP